MEDVAFKAAFDGGSGPQSGTFDGGAGLRRGTFDGGSGPQSGTFDEDFRWRTGPRSGTFDGGSGLRRGTFEGGSGFSMEDLALEEALSREDLAVRAAFRWRMRLSNWYFEWKTWPSKRHFDGGSGPRSGTFDGGAGLRRGTFEGGSGRRSGFSMEDLAFEEALLREAPTASAGGFRTTTAQNTIKERVLGAISRDFGANGGPRTRNRGFLETSAVRAGNSRRSLGRPSFAPTTSAGGFRTQTAQNTI